MIFEVCFTQPQHNIYISVSWYSIISDMLDKGIIATYDTESGDIIVIPFQNPVQTSDLKEDKQYSWSF